MVQLDDLVAATGSWHTQRGEHSDGFFAMRIYNFRSEDSKFQC